ncbi:hypothetical protein [Frankia canadensis]|uniref:hypothetical protein n=1 Tax=Frankia canadensis TaxID=1836972 RepID=UPI000C7A7809|nr:hypothetical protein [Frankia canadensis]
MPADSTDEPAATIPATRDGASAPLPPMPTEAAAVAIDGDAELVASLMVGMSTDERARLLSMISSSIEAERSAALEGTVRRQVDVGVRRRRWSRRPAGVDAGPAPAEGVEAGPGPERSESGDTGTGGARA